MVECGEEINYFKKFYFFVHIFKHFIFFFNFFNNGLFYCKNLLTIGALVEWLYPGLNDAEERDT
jgi:hypothetical protein